MFNNIYYNGYCNEPYYRLPLEQFPPYGCYPNRCGYGCYPRCNNDFVRTPIHTFNNQNYNQQFNHRNNYVKFKEYEQFSDNNSYNDRYHNNRAFDSCPYYGHYY